MLTSFASEAWSQRYLIKFIVCDYVLLMLCHLLLPSTVREFKMNSHVPACGLEATQLTYVLYAFCTIHVNVANALCYSTSKGIHCTRTVVWDFELRLGSLCQKVATTFKYVISTFSAAQSRCFTKCRHLQDVRVWKRRTCNALYLQLRTATWAWTQLLAHRVSVVWRAADFTEGASQSLYCHRMVHQSWAGVKMEQNSFYCFD
jgi:hypothetical protein